MIEILIAVGAAALVVFTVVFNIIRRKKGKTSCGCDSTSKKGGCSSCHGCTGCSAHKARNE